MIKIPEIVKHEGKEGLLKVTLDSLSAKDEILIYETSFASLNRFLDIQKAEDFRQKLMEKGIRVRQITNQAYREEYTKVKGFDEKVMNIRYIDSKQLNIKTEFLVYNDAVAYYTLEEPIYAIQVKDQQLADMQRQIFEFVWKSGERPIIKNGRTSIF